MAVKMMNFNVTHSQKAVWDFLSKSIANNKIGSAYIFSGPTGSGKEAMSIEFGAAINRDYSKVDSNLAEANYKRFKSLQHELLKIIVPLPVGKAQKDKANPLSSLNKDELGSLRDNIEQKSINPLHKINIAGATRIRIDSIRELRKTLYLKSDDAGRKIVLIFDAHLLSVGQAESANALLKILEEPPNQTTLILVTDNKNQLLPTILSRCQQIDFPPLTKEVISSTLLLNGMSDDIVKVIADISQGNIHQASKLSETSIENLISDIRNISHAIVIEDGNVWRKFVNDNSQIIRKELNQFQFKIYLLQLWFESVYRLRIGVYDELQLPELLDFMKEFNQKYPNADLQKINILLEDTLEAIGKNLYMSLILTNLLIGIQRLIK